MFQAASSLWHQGRTAVRHYLDPVQERRLSGRPLWTARCCVTRPDALVSENSIGYNSLESHDLLSAHTYSPRARSTGAP